MNNDRPRDAVLFNTESLPQCQRFDAFRDAFIRRYMALDIVVGEPGKFRGSLEFRRAGAVDIGLISGSPFSFRRTPSLVRDGDDGVVFALCRRGRFRAQQGTNDNSLAPGDAVLLDNSQLGDMSAVVSSSFWGLKIPRSRLRRLVPGIDDQAGHKIGRGVIAVKLLFRSLEVFRAADGEPDRQFAHLVGDHIIDLVAHALGAQGDARRLVAGRGLREIRRLAVFDEIHRHFGDFELNAAKVAQRMGISPRYVHSLLDETGRTFSQYLLEVRLKHVMQMLISPGCAAQKIADLAFEAGFTDLSHFNRSFRQRFGATPSDVRADAAG